MSPQYPTGYPAPSGIVFNYTCTLQTDANHSYTWTGQQALGVPQGVTVTNANLATLTAGMQADILNQMENGTPGGAPSYAQQRLNNASHG